ncbi:hypothetical protein B296_00030905 [Ensete ventricosum]|uniref:Trichome birefringence-like C-terminal domain-containing protein n=1 Tax=Ensete ventricosum TaxID=4639 RepID=A0A426Z8P7_ENSVE|nr:hypothetical protein B296_00030905 [Ensete ventricosum]
MRLWAFWFSIASFGHCFPLCILILISSWILLIRRSSYWGNPDGIKCAKETIPIKNMTGVRLGMDKNLFAVAKNVTGSTARVPITFIDITTMSEFRKDAHTSVYTVRQGELLTPEQQAKPAEFADCIHWCVPGLPDTWNQILYARLLSARPRQ